MIHNKYFKFLQSINEESGIKNITKIIKYQLENNGNEFEIWFHQDLDGVCSALAMKKYIEDYGLKLVDAHIIQYGGIEYAIKQKRKNTLCCLVDFAHGKPMFHIHTDHHDKQAGAETALSTSFRPSRSNVETISGIISPSSVFTSTDISLIQTVDSANFLKYNIKPEDIQNAIFKYNRDENAERNRFLMGFVVNRLLLSLKTKRISVIKGKKSHTNKNLLECLVVDSNPSLYSIFNNLKYYINNAISLEWDMGIRSHHTPKKLASPEDITNNLMAYINTRKELVDEEGTMKKNQTLTYDSKYKIISQYGIGSVFKTGSYDRYVVFKNFPEADFVCTVFPMGLIQVSCNPFKEKILKEINLGKIAKEVISKFKFQFKNMNIGIGDIKRISEDEIKKMKDRYGDEYEAVGFKMTDLKAFYKNSITYLPMKEKGDMKTKAKLDLEDTSNPYVRLLEEWMNIPYVNWTKEVKDKINWLKIPLWDIILEMSGGHHSITNIQGLNFMSTRKDILKILFKTEVYTDVMKVIAGEFIKILRAKIDKANSGQNLEYQGDDVELKSNVVLEDFEYYIKDDEVKSVSKDEFIKFGMDNMFSPKKDDEKGFKMDIEDNKIYGYYENFKSI